MVVKAQFFGMDYSMHFDISGSIRIHGWHNGSVAVVAKILCMIKFCKILC